MAEVVELSVDEKGRISIPLALQNRLGLEPGMTLIVEEGDNGGVRLRPNPERVTLLDKEGILVVRAEPVADLTDVVRRERDLRVVSLLERAAP
jgi:AbrB family looped-hinge helix DNA binding protein